MNRSTTDILVEACISQNIDVVGILVKKGVDVNRASKEWTTPLLAACYIGDESIVELLLDSGAKVDEPGCVYNNDKLVCEGTPLIVAIKMKRNNIVEALIKKGAELNKTYWMGKTALIYAVENENEGAIDALIRRKADVNCVPLGRETALLIAVRNNNESIMERLLDNGADANCVSLDKETVLMVAVRNNNEFIARKLLSKGADVDYELEGKTALNLAIENKNKSLVRLLMDNFANLDILEKERNGNNKKFVEEILEDGHMRLSIRSGNCELLRKQLSQCVLEDGYISKLEKEIDDMVGSDLPNDIREIANEMKGILEDCRHNKCYSLKKSVVSYAKVKINIMNM